MTLPPSLDRPAEVAATVRSAASRRAEGSPSAKPTVLKLGGELLEQPERLAQVAVAVRAMSEESPLIVVHGGGKEIDAETARRGLTRRAVDGLRITDAATLDAVVAVLAGTVNTRVVASLVDVGVAAVGLTGADAACVRVRPSAPHQASDGTAVDLGLVGEPVAAGSPTLLVHLLAEGYVPVLACLGIGDGGQLYNVNADTLAAHLAATVGAGRLVIAGATAGVLDRDGTVIPSLTLTDLAALVADGTASAGMVAKLVACRAALDRGVSEVVIVDGRQAATILEGSGTRLLHHVTDAQNP